MEESPPLSPIGLLASIQASMEKHGKRVIAIAGSTASGKSALAVDMARALRCTVLSADSRLVYRGMDIGTAKPDAATRVEIPHAGVDLMDPDQACTLAIYLDAARPVLDRARAAGEPLVIVGGTGLYMDALIYGYELPEGEVPPETVAELRAASLHAMLEELDRRAPEEGRRVDRGNRHRVERSLGYVRATGSQLSDKARKAPIADDVLLVGLDVPTPVLSRRITARVDAMFDAGLLQEVHELAATYGRHAPGLNAIGYKDVLEGEEQGRSEEWIRFRIAARTRQYAKRQRTWNRRNADVRWLPVVA